MAVHLVDGVFAGARVHRRAADAIEMAPAGALVGIDIPIGFPENRPTRRADELARERLRGRRECVFWAPPLTVLRASTPQAANAEIERLRAPRPSPFAWGLKRKILEVDDLVTVSGMRIREVHPELSFAEMNGGTAVSESKKTWAGHVRRRQLLAEQGVLVPNVHEAGRAEPHDVLDAAAAAWSAHRCALNLASSLPDGNNSEYDPRGYMVAIWV